MSNGDDDNGMSAQVTRSEILPDVEAMIFARLFGSGRWLPDMETAAVLDRRLEQMGLQERVPGDGETCTPCYAPTPLNWKFCGA